MADYNSMKVPELKKLLSERGLTQNGNKADLIARLQDNDKEKLGSKETDEAAAPTATSGQDDEIDYDDDDIVPAVTAKTATTTETKEETTAPAKATEAVTEVTSEKTAETAPEAASAEEPKPEDAGKAEKATTTDEPAFSQHLPPTDAKTEAEKRALRRARFGTTVEEGSEDAKKKDRAQRFGVANDHVAAIDSALPDRPRKRGRDNEDKADENTRGNKRQSTGAPGGRPNDKRNNRHRNRRHGGANNQNEGQQKKSGGPAPAKKAQPASIDPAEKAKMEARAKRFAEKN